LRKFLSEKPHFHLDTIHWHNYALAIVAGKMSLSWYIPSECHIGQPDFASRYTVLCQEVSPFCLNGIYGRSSVVLPWFNVQIFV